VTEDPTESDPATWAPRLAMEQYLRYRLRRVDQCSDGWYALLRPFVEWCERVGAHSVGALRGVDLEEYYDQRRNGVETDCLEQEMRTLERFCSFLDDVGATRGGKLAQRCPRPTDQPMGSPRDDSTGRRRDGATRRGRRCRPQEPVGPGEATARKSREFEYEIGPDESVTTAVVRMASAVDGRSPQFMPPLRNVVDPRALDAIFEAKPEGTARTGGRLSFVYGSCQVLLQSGEYLTLQPLDLVQRSDPTLPPGTRSAPSEARWRSPRLLHDTIRRVDPDSSEDE
jgi:hypothetical protein